MCFKIETTCDMCSERIEEKVELCADGMAGRICVFAYVDMIRVELSKPRAGSRSYVDMRKHLQKFMNTGTCTSCAADMVEQLKSMLVRDSAGVQMELDPYSSKDNRFVEDLKMKLIKTSAVKMKTDTFEFDASQLSEIVDRSVKSVFRKNKPRS